MSKKNKLKAITFSSILSILVSGCSNNILSENHSQKNYDNTVSNDVDNDDSLEENPDFEYVKYFESLDVEYKTFESSLSDEEILNIAKQAKINKDCTFSYDGNLSNLEEKIEDNSFIFCSNNKDFIPIFLQSSDDSNISEIKKVCIDSFNVVIEKFIKESTNDLDEDICHMQTLSIVLGDTSKIEEKFYDFNSDIIPACYIDEENVIVIDYQACLNAFKKDSYSNIVNNLSLTLEHELNHFKTRMCLCREQYNQYTSIDYNPPFVCFMSESSAESALYNLEENNNYEEVESWNYAYIQERQAESLLFLLALFNEDVIISDYYNAIFDTNFKKIYEFFELETKEDYLDFYHILFNIDASFGRNSALSEYFNKDLSSINERKKIVGYSHRNEIFNRTLAKMAEYTLNHNDFSLEENLILLNFIKFTVLDGAYYLNKLNNDSYDKIFEKEFSENFWNSNMKYIEFLSNHFNIEVDKIEDEESSITRASILFSDKLESLFAKFPLLKPMLITSDYFYSALYEEFIDKNNFSYQKIK